MERIFTTNLELKMPLLQSIKMYMSNREDMLQQGVVQELSREKRRIVSETVEKIPAIVAPLASGLKEVKGQEVIEMDDASFGVSYNGCIPGLADYECKSEYIQPKGKDITILNANHKITWKKNLGSEAAELLVVGAIKEMSVQRIRETFRIR